MMKRISINFEGGDPLPPKWAWVIATWLPQKVRNAVVMMFLASCSAYATGGLDATIREVLAEARGDDESTIKWSRPEDDDG
jgi:hypothetical protein